jgi:3',5'-cyclic-AMP phosphodiesterase
MNNRKVIIQISDMHITGDGLMYDRVDSLGNLVTILSSIEHAGSPPDLLLFTGDTADSGEPAAYRRFRETVEPFAERLGAPVLYVPGNHDARAAFREHLLDGEPVEDTIDQVLWLDGLRIVALDSTAPPRDYGELEDQQLTWLKAELATPAPLGTILALHHPPIGSPSRFLDMLALRAPERLAAAIAGTDVLMIVAGHNHLASAGVLAGVPVWVAAASAYQMDMMAAAADVVQGLAGSAFSRIDVADGSAVATHIPVHDGRSPLYQFDFETLQRAAQL